jgi:hypothetical protein
MTEESALKCIFHQGIGQVSKALSVPRRDVYMWRVIYRDGTYTDEFDEARPDGRGWREREDKPVAEIQLLAHDRDGHQMLIPIDASPVFFRRRSIELNPNVDMQIHRTTHCIGWKYGEQAAYLFVLPNGSTLLTSDLQAV